MNFSVRVLIAFVCLVVVVFFLTKLVFRLGPANSTANLLEDVEGNPSGKQCQPHLFGFLYFIGNILYLCGYLTLN